MNVASRKVYGQDEVTWWLPYDRFEDANNLSKVTLKITANEAGSGLKYLKLAENAEFTENTKLYVGSELLTRDTAYKLNTATKTIELLDWYTPKLINANGGTHEITLENIKLNNINAPAGTSQGNKIKLTTDDFVGKTTDNANNIYYGDTNVTGTLVYADSIAPQIASLTVEDSQDDTADDFDNKAYDKEKYTNNQTVVLYLTLGDTEVGNKGSGVNKVILSVNAVFTGTTDTGATEIFVVNDSTETKLASPADYEIASDNKSVTFKKVFTETNKLKFTNVNIISATNGQQIIKADVQDFAGIKSVTSEDTNAIVFDNLQPVVSSIKWVTKDATVTVGQSNNKTILEQDLKVVFTDATAGVKVIKMDIIHLGVSTVAYATPFGTEFKLLKADGVTPFTTNEYTIDGQYIILNTPSTNETVFFHGITLKDTKEEGTYAINVTLLDASENRIDTDSYTNSQNHKPNILIDTVAPVITNDLEIPGLKQTTELSTTTPTLDGYWLEKESVGGTGTGKTPDQIKVYITLKEQSSGIKVLKFVGENENLSSVVKLSRDNTTLYTVAADGKETEITPREERYEVNPDTNEIIIKSEFDAKNNFSKQDGSEFKILIKNVGFVNADDQSKASINSIYLTASDVAKNVSNTKTTPTSVPRILSDSRTPAAPASLTLKDRAHSTANKTIEASNGYTNESIVDMTFNLTDSEKFGSGYHKFVLTGASFIGGNSADKTTITVKDSSGTVIPGVEFTLSADGKTLTLKKTGQATDVYAVIRQAVSVELKNVQLDNASTNGSHTVTLKAYDLTGWDSTTVSTSITLDTEKPVLEKGVFAADYSKVNYYKASINVYPHANGETAEGVSINYDGKSVPTFYTATTYKTGYYQVNGEVSSSSSAPAVTNFIHGAVLGIHAKDNIMLGGYNSDKTFLYYYKYSDTDTLFSKAEAEILASNNNPIEDIHQQRQPSGATAQSTSLWFGFDEGKYSAVIVDEAGNCSDVFHFAVVRDVTKPLNTGANKLNDRVLLQMPDANAQVYMKNAVSEASSSEFNRFYSYNASSSSIRTKKYVTKKTENKYKIQLNLGGTYTSSTPITKIDGSTAGSTSPYTDLSATGEHSPIEMYAISTFYGAWPDTFTAGYKYSPVVPYGTTFPSGQTHNSSTTGDTNISYLLGHEYFYSGEGANKSNAWRIPDSATMGWHSYTKTSSWNSDKIVSSNSNTEIKSRIDDNNNLIIEIPNTQSTAPISVFLRDGCGNMQYVVCGLYEESAGKEVAISFIIDDKLGSAPTSEGVVTKPFIIQFPYSLADSSGDVPWGSQIYKVGDQSANSEDPSSYKGTGQKRGFIKDYVKYATYYNPDLVPTLKHGFALHFFPNNVDRSVASNITGKEDVTFSDAGWTDEEKAKGIRQASASDIADGNYTCRALLYCTDSPSTPSYTTIKTLHDTQFANGTTEATRTGQVTDWTYIQVSSSAIEAILLLDYPKPNYSKLNWSTNETNGEPKPFYMWYIFEDRVGNYELAKVVNDATSGDSLKTTNSSHFDKWLYDAEAPKLTIRGTSTDPSTITAANIGQLVATNNGFVPYVNGNNVYVHASKTHSSLQAGASLNENIGKGTTHKADGHESYSVYNNFVDLSVTEITGVRAFAWSTSNNIDFSSTYGDSSSWYTGVSGYWYVGWGSVSSTGGLEKDIGNGSFTYSSKPENAYYYGSSNYSGLYSGTKVCTAFPYGKLTSENELWLHVMDWTGNISHYRMGAEGVKFNNDSTAPTYSSSGFDGITEPDQYYLSKASSSNPVVRIAGNGPTAKAGSAIKLYIPKTWFDENGSGIKGYSFSNTGLANATYDENSVPYLNLTYDDYHYTDTDSHEKTFYVYDNVGNMSERKINLVFDDKPPKITKVAFVTKLEDTNQGKFCDTENGLATQNVGDVNYPKFGSVQFYTHKDKNSANEDINLYYDDISDISIFKDGEVQEIYINKAGAVKFQVNFDSEILTETDYLDDIKINRWNDTTKEWETVTSWKTNNTSWWVGDTDTGIRAMGTSDSTGYDKLTYTADGTYYQILATDISGNASCQYFKLYLDNQGPELVARTGETSTTPTIELGKGSINSDETDTYYYTADSTGKATIKFAMTDAGMKNSKQKFYYSFDNSTWETINNPADTLTEINATVASGNLDKIYLKDIFENKSTIDVNFKYTYGSNDTTIDIPALTYWNTKPATPTFKVNADDATILTTDDLSGNNSWSAWNTSLLADTTGTIAINGKSLKWTKISFTKSDKIIGYLVTDGAGNLIKEAEYGEAQQYGRTIYVQNIKDTYLSDEYKRAIGSYSFKTDLKNTFTETLPLLINNGKNTSYAQAVRKYYAVDVVGNISDPLILTYTYSNPSHQAIDIHLIRSLNEIEASDVKDTITAAVNNGTLKLAQIADTIEGSTTTRFFSGDYLLLSCTLKEKGSNSNNDTPARVELVDIWSGAYPGSAVRGYATGDNIIVYNSDKKNNEDRYYCYVAFKVGNDVGPDNNKQWSYDAFDNNDQWGGSQLYLRVYGKATNGNQKGTESDSYLLNPANEIDIRWKRDITGPAIISDYLSGSNVCNYTPSSTINVVYDKDLANTWTGRTNSYSSGLKITIPATGIKDGFKYTGDNGSINSGTFVNYSGVAQYKTVVTGTGGAESNWQSLVADNDGNYTISIPDVTTVHSEIKLYVRDSLGNVSSEYKLGKHNEATSAWWILNNRLTEGVTTVTAPSAGWVSGANSIFDVTPPEGSIITSVTAKVGDADLDVKGVTFNRYDGTPKDKNNKDIPMSNGWLNLSGLKVTVAPIAQNWNPQSVTITLNGSISKTVSNFVPAKKLSASNITLTQATWNPNGNAQTEYDVAITMNGSDNLSAPSIDKLEGMTLEAYLGDTKMTNIDVSFDKNNSKFTIKGAGIPRVKTWTNQVIKIKISDDNGDNIVDGGITLDAMTISPISADDITINQLVTSGDTEEEQTIAWNSATVNNETGERTFKLKFNCPTPIPEGTSISTNDVGTISLFDVDNQTAILKVKKGWGEQPVNITIGSVTKEGVLTVPAIDADDITISSSPAAWASTTTNNEYTLTVGVKGAVTLKASDFSVSNATISTAWNASTSTLKIKPVDQSWTTDQDVVVTIHNVVTPKILTVQKRNLADGDISLGTPAYDSTNQRYYMSVTRNNGVSKDNLASVSATNATTNEQIIDTNNIRFSGDKTKIYFYSSKLPAKLWNQQQPINLTITASNGSSITKASVLTVEAIAADDITVQFVKDGVPENLANNTWYAINTTNDNGEKVFPLKITAPTALPQDCVVKYGEQTLSFDPNDTTNSIVLLPLKEKVQQQTVVLTINGITKTTVMTVPARNLAAGDITVSTATWGTTPYELTISYSNGASKSNISNITADNGVTATLDTNKTKVTLTNVSKGWSQKDIKLTLNGSIDLGVVLTVPAKVPANCITVTPTSPATWASGKTSVTFTVASSDSSLSITKVLYGETELNKSNNAYTITAAEGQTIAEDVTITIKTKHDDVETDVTTRIFPISVNQNRFFGRAISINGLQEVYTFADTPSSVAAMQTRIIELPAVVQKAWESFSEEKEEVAAAVAPASQVVEPKKSSKKTSKKAAKKAAKKAVEAVTETAAALEVTELPVELLEEPKADDQLAMILPQTAITEEVTAIDSAAITTQAKAPDQITPLASQASADTLAVEPGSNSKAVLWIILCMFCIAVAGVVFGFKKKEEK